MGALLNFLKKQQWGWVVRPQRHEGLRGHGVTRLCWDHYGLDLEGVTRFGYGRQLFFFCYMVRSSCRCRPSPFTAWPHN